MTTLGGLARFTPSLLDHQTLEALFVHREALVADAIERIERAAATKERSSRLFIGPRGAGKTHLVSLVYHRAKALDGYGSTFQLAWLPEDLWGISDFDDLMRDVVRRVEPEPAEGFEGSAAGHVRALAVEHGPIVVLVENLDLVLEDIGLEGQQRLRALLEDERALLLIGTATRLSSELLDQTVPFYGFFDTHHLEPFSVDQARDMLKEIARQRGDEELVEELDEPRARARLAVIDQLAGGQPRIWALFGSGLTVDGLDHLVSTLLERFDDLTPYYQEQMRRLSVHERKVIRALADADRSLPVNEIADLVGVDQRSLAKTMTNLRRAGWVRPRTGLLASMTDQRRTYYDLAEPLARLAFQLKESRGEPLRLIVDFLKAWFSRGQLGSEIVVSDPVVPYLEAASQAGHLEEVADACRAIGIALAEPVGLSSEAGARLLRLDVALEAFGHGDPCLLLAEPSVISSIMESHLSEFAVADLRADVAMLGLGAGRYEDWADRMDDLVAGDPDPSSIVLAAAFTYNAAAGRRSAAERYLGRLVKTVDGPLRRELEAAARAYVTEATLMGLSRPPPSGI